MANKPIKLNILQWNAQSIRPKLASFQELLCQEKVHIAVLSETWLDAESNFKVKCYDVYRSDRDDSYGGVAILLHKSIKSQLRRVHVNNNGIEVVCVRLHNCYPVENIVSLYCPSSVITYQQDWDSLLSIWRSKTLIFGDFNAHHTSWSHKTDRRGNLLYDSLIDSNYITLNDGTYTRVRLVDSN